MPLVRMCSAIRFRQKRFVEPYFSCNSGRCAAARNAFEKDYYKLKNNSFFGKTMEDVLHCIDYRLLRRWDKVERLSSNPLFVDTDIFSDIVVSVRMLKSRVELTKPVYIGQAVLDYSKLEIHNLHYNVLHSSLLIRQSKLVGRDTDSFFLAFHTDRTVSLGDVFRHL